MIPLDTDPSWYGDYRGFRRYGERFPFDEDPSWYGDYWFSPRIAREQPTLSRRIAGLADKLRRCFLLAGHAAARLWRRRRTGKSATRAHSLSRQDKETLPHP